MGDAKKISGALSEGTVVVSSTARYVVSRVLGAGGFGITYKVIRQSDGLIFALKEYFPDKLCERGGWRHYVVSENKRTDHRNRAA